MKIIRKIVLLVALSLLLAGFASAKLDALSIEGTVTDSTGALVASGNIGAVIKEGAIVKWANANAATISNGIFEALLFGTGNYGTLGLSCGTTYTLHLMLNPLPALDQYYNLQKDTTLGGDWITPTTPSPGGFAFTACGGPLFRDDTLTTGYLVIQPQDTVQEGGELQLLGTASYGAIQLDNYQGNFRVHTLASGKNMQIIGGGLNVAGSTTTAGLTVSSPGITVSSGGMAVTGASTITGDTTIDGKVFASQWFRSKGTTGWYSEDYGGGWHMTDSVWVRSYTGKHVYTEGVMRGDGGLQVGDPLKFNVDTNGNVVASGSLTASSATITGTLTTNGAITSKSSRTYLRGFDNGFDSTGMHWIMTSGTEPNGNAIGLTYNSRDVQIGGALSVDGTLKISKLFIVNGRDACGACTDSNVGELVECGSGGDCDGWGLDWCHMTNKPTWSCVVNYAG